MYKYNFVLLFLIAFISGCTTFNHIEVLKPEVGFLTRDAYSVNPVLAWKALEDYSGSYDLVVMTRGERAPWAAPKPNKIVYYKTNIKDTWHEVAIPLNEDFRYSWAIRKNSDDSDEAWSKFNYYFFGGIFAFWWLDVNFRFDINVPPVQSNESASAGNNSQD